MYNTQLKLKKRSRSRPAHIPCKDLIYYAYGIPGTIKFDYECLVGIETKYGQVWQGRIDTRVDTTAPCAEG
ncbi:hypothetical protein XNC1_4524 [Xenorhabdus nematophila ATCC 19061]|uniref:Uncharacterized protein n=1 Tax=Xenorhabdus nematophila (strain ATCC 19061 / DSM 3370 / CCUG 14189 / LMG 1036 / NCIMB 9965 / AN6) TaxID=406817 RepID=D3VF89_XENNA|nr:hypothetical protein XNC1_4524 [Xenorhabdus nematophila ATCC 19061]